MTVLPLLDDNSEQSAFRSQADFLGFDYMQADMCFITVGIICVDLIVLSSFYINIYMLNYIK